MKLLLSVGKEKTIGLENILLMAKNTKGTTNYSDIYFSASLLRNFIASSSRNPGRLVVPFPFPIL